MVEDAALEMLKRLTPFVGSNPIPSSNNKSLKPFGFKLLFFIKLRNMLGNRRQQGL